LTDNPIRCDCDLRWIPTFLEDNARAGPSPYNFGSCNFPPTLLNEAISDLNVDNFTCGML